MCNFPASENRSFFPLEIFVRRWLHERFRSARSTANENFSLKSVKYGKVVAIVADPVTKHLFGFTRRTGRSRRPPFLPHQRQTHGRRSENEAKISSLRYRRSKTPN